MNGGRRFDSELFSQDDRESDQDVETETGVRMSKGGSAGRKEVIGRGKEPFVAPVKRKKKSKMHCCEICSKKFPRPSGLRTHMNTHSNAKPFPCGFPGCTRSFGVRSNAKRHLRTHGVIPTPSVNPNSADAPYIVGFCPPMIGVPQLSSRQPSQSHSLEGGEDCPSSNSRDNTNIHTTQDQGQRDMQREMSAAPIVKLRWMPQSLTTRTNAKCLKEVRDKQQMNWMRDVPVEEKDEEDEDDFDVGGSGGITVVGRTGGGGYDMVREQDDEGDELDFGENVPRLRPSAVPSSSTNSVASLSSTGIQLTVSRPPTDCTCSPPCSEGTCSHHRSSPCPSRTMASSISPVSSTSFAGSNSPMSPPSMATYNRQLHGVREACNEERNSYVEESHHPYHASSSSQHPNYFR